MFDVKPVMQHFLGKPVRVFRATFQVGMGSRNMTSSSRVFTLQTYAIPLPDLCNSIGILEHGLRQMIKQSEEVFAGLYRTEPLLDALGRMQQTILLSQEMVDGLVFKLSTSRIKDPETRARVVEFQRFVMLTIGLIRKGKLKAVHDPAQALASTPPAYQDLLLLTSGRDLRQGVDALAAEEGKSTSTVYRKLLQYRGNTVITKTGQPRKRRTVR